jgi:hypothetical protein
MFSVGHATSPPPPNYTEALVIIVHSSTLTLLDEHMPPNTCKDKTANAVM